jgi:hypothetical protein
MRNQRHAVVDVAVASDAQDEVAVCVEHGDARVVDLRDEGAGEVIQVEAGVEAVAAEAFGLAVSGVKADTAVHPVGAFDPGGVESSAAGGGEVRRARRPLFGRERHRRRPRAQNPARARPELDERVGRLIRIPPAVQHSAGHRHHVEAAVPVNGRAVRERQTGQRVLVLLLFVVSFERERPGRRRPRVGETRQPRDLRLHHVPPVKRRVVVVHPPGGDVDLAGAVVEQDARGVLERQRLQQLTVGLKDLHAVVAVVGDVDAPRLVAGHGTRETELPVARPALAVLEAAGEHLDRSVAVQVEPRDAVEPAHGLAAGAHVVGPGVAGQVKPSAVGAEGGAGGRRLNGSAAAPPGQRPARHRDARLRSLERRGFVALRRRQSIQVHLRQRDPPVAHRHRRRGVPHLVLRTDTKRREAGVVAGTQERGLVFAFLERQPRAVLREGLPVQVLHRRQPRRRERVDRPHVGPRVIEQPQTVHHLTVEDIHALRRRDDDGRGAAQPLVRRPVEAPLERRPETQRHADREP